MQNARERNLRTRLITAFGVLLVLLLLGFGCTVERSEQPVPPSAVTGTLERLPSNWGIVTSQEAYENKPFLVDVRDEGEFATGFVEGAINIPLRELAKGLDALPGMDEEIVVVCCSGPRSTIAMTALRVLGFSNAHVLAGGMTAWRSALLPVAGGPAPRPATGVEHAIDPELVNAVDRFLSTELADDWGMIDAQDLRQQLDDGPPFVLDVRQPSELDEGRIEGALHIPLRELPERMDLIPKDRPVTIVDASGHRSTVAMTALQMMGYPAVTSLSGGMILWQASGGGDEQFYAVTAKIEAYLDDPPADWGLISHADLVAADPFLLDLRTLDAYLSGFVEGAVNVPLRELTDNLGALPALDEPIVVISDSGTESAIGMMALQLLGYQHVSSLAGGMEAWESAELPLATDPVPAPEGAAPDVDFAVLQALDYYLTQGLPDDYGLVDVSGLEEAMEVDVPVATTVIDVRQPDQFAIDGLETVFNLPLEDLLEGLDEIPVEPLRTT